MANEQYAFIDKSSIPDRESWQAAVRECGFDLQLDPEWIAGESTGFAPCEILGREAGVEIYCDDDADFMSQFQDIAPGKDYCISFRWGGSMAECACAMVLSVALVKNFGAIVSYEGEPPVESVADLLVETEAIVKDVEKE